MCERIVRALAEGKTTFQYVGEPTLTRGDYGEIVENVHRMAWGMPCDECVDDCDICDEQSQWYESNTGHAWGIWDSNYGWLIWHNLPGDEIGEPI